MPIQGYTPNKSLVKTAQNSTDNWDVWNNQNLDTLDEPVLTYNCAAAESLSAVSVAVIKDDGTGAKKAYLATGSAYVIGDPLGIVMAQALAGSPVQLALEGRVQNGAWSFGPADKFVYLSSSGTVTVTPTGVKLGYVLSSTAIYFIPPIVSGGQTDTVTGANGLQNTGSNVNAVVAPVYGSAANTVCQGNDTRLHNQNTDPGTSAVSFEINNTGNSARLLTTGLTANRDYTLPDATTKLVGESSPAAITAQHSFSPTAPAAPFALGANAQGQLVTGLNADQLDGSHASAFATAGHIHATTYNPIINGSAIVAQRVTGTDVIKNASANTYVRGACDMFTGAWSGSACAAGSLNQDTTAAVGITGYAHHFSGVTLTGTGVLYHRARIESVNAKAFKNQTASFQVKVLHDTGSNVNFTAYLRKANSADNFSAVTAIGDSGAVAVVSGAATLLSLENVSMGDCSNGIEIEVIAAVGAITTKNLRLTEYQLNLGPTITDVARRAYQQELALCQRYYYRFIPTKNHDVFGVGQAYNATTAIVITPFPVPMRTNPTTIDQSGTAGDYALTNSAMGDIACTSIPAIAGAYTSRYAGAVTMISTGITWVSPYGIATFGQSTNSNGHIGWIAEL